MLMYAYIIINKGEKIMAFCKHCGKDVGNDNFCAGCGAPVEQQNKANNNYANDNNAPAANNNEYNAQSDAQQNKVMAVLAYIGILVLVPILAAPNSKFARFHANQGLVLFICEIIVLIAVGILDVIFASLDLWIIGSILWWIAWISFLVLAILGIVNAAKGKTEKLPVIGKFTILK